MFNSSQLRINSIDLSKTRTNWVFQHTTLITIIMVWHKALIIKFQTYGISGYLLQWLTVIQVIEHKG